ncbi:sensor histidine kinase [Noviherbaspirillum aerium]|uniref:sensor histidine kinase n=1 Tax=Noviherbaspirillum aerium TaxID=2588497 RepID=UPI00124EEDB7|nr:ATP-binding protein [Noviherbaspirillum aerium]
MQDEAGPEKTVNAARVRKERAMPNFAAWLAIALLSLAAAWPAYQWAQRKGYDALDEVSVHQLDLYAAGLESELGKHDYLPSLLELDPDILALLGGANDPQLLRKANRRLSSLNVRAGSIAIFAIDNKGIVRAASNWFQPESLVGQDLSDVPYFARAIEDGQAGFFAPNIDLESPEYYFAQSIRREGKVVGVAVVKISLAPVESTWAASLSHPQSEKLLVVDANDMIVISSVSEWKYQTTPLISALRKVRHGREQDGASQLIAPLGIVIEGLLEHGNHLVRLPRSNPSLAERRFMTQDRFMVRTGWHIVTLSDASDVTRNARYAGFGAGAFTAFLGLLGLYIVQRRRVARIQAQAAMDLRKAHDELELKVHERTAELNSRNAELRREIVERKRTEHVLREAQDELVQASKLAVLGQMAAGITHEINQPLTALRSLSHNAKLSLQRGNSDRLSHNLDAISAMTERMGRITSQLKSFARKAPLTLSPVVLADSVDNALFLLQSRVRSAQAEVSVEIAPRLRVLCDANRLEQVLINLIANALDAMQDLPADARRTLSIATQPQDKDGRVTVRIADSGAGIPADTMPHLFEPFFSTKPQGEGLGLGLVISSGIVQEFGGVLRARNDERGAVFEFDLKSMGEMQHV